MLPDNSKGRNFFSPPPAIVKQEHSLAELANKANYLHVEGEKARAKGLENFRHVGLTLLQAKEQVERGQFVKWLKEQLKFSKTQAYRYMSLAKLPVTGNLEEQWRVISGNVDPPEDDEDAKSATVADLDAADLPAGPPDDDFLPSARFFLGRGRMSEVAARDLDRLRILDRLATANPYYLARSSPSEEWSWSGRCWSDQFAHDIVWSGDGPGRRGMKRTDREVRDAIDAVFVDLFLAAGRYALLPADEAEQLLRRRMAVGNPFGLGLEGEDRVEYVLAQLWDMLRPDYRRVSLDECDRMDSWIRRYCDSEAA
jgi:hypothetical protein